MDLSGNGNMLLAGIICAFLTLFQIYPKTTHKPETVSEHSEEQFNLWIVDPIQSEAL